MIHVTFIAHCHTVSYDYSCRCVLTFKNSVAEPLNDGHVKSLLHSRIRCQNELQVKKEDSYNYKDKRKHYIVSHKKHTKIVLVISSTKLNQFL